MNVNYRLTPFSLMEKFNFVLDKLAEDKRNMNLDEAIISWCKELSLEKDFPQISRAIIRNKNEWIQQNAVVVTTIELYRQLLVVTDQKIMGGIGNSFTFNRLKNISRKDFYHNIREVKQEMSAKSVILIAFILTGVGLLLYLLNKKNTPHRQSKIENNTYSSYISPTPEKYILVLLINSGYYQDLIHSLKNNSYLQPQDASKLYGATQDLWFGKKNKFDKSQIKQALINFNSDIKVSEYDVNFVTIELEEDDSRFHPDVNPMDRRDAFVELGKRSPRITVSPRLSCKAYENTEFYSR